jgi:hypothetical protein
MLLIFMYIKFKKQLFKDYIDVLGFEKLNQQRKST